MARANRRAPQATWGCAGADSGEGCGAGGMRLGESRGSLVPRHSQAGGALKRRAQSPSRAGGGAERVWLHIWGARAAGGGQTPRIRRGWGWKLPERPIGFTRFGDFPLYPSVPSKNLRTERELPYPPQLASLSPRPTSFPTFVGRNSSLAPLFSVLHPGLILFSSAPLSSSFPVVPRIRAPSAFCLALFPLSFLSPYLIFRPSS